MRKLFLSHKNSLFTLMWIGVTVIGALAMYETWVYHGLKQAGVVLPEPGTPQSLWYWEPALSLGALYCLILGIRNLLKRKLPDTD